MNHEALYYQLVNKDHQDTLRHLVHDQLVSVGYQPVTVGIKTDAQLPYVDCRVDTEQIFCAQMIGFFVDITALVPDYTQPYYYLPVVVTCDNYSARIQGFINRDVSLAHELMHIRDILALIKQQPDYPDRLYRYGLNSITQISDLPQSIDLEVFKLFYIEPPAMRMDYEKGETAIFIPLDDDANTVVRYVCDSADEYLGMSLHSYLLDIKHRYYDRFDDEVTATQCIDAEIDAALTRHGQAVFGPKPLQGLNDFKQRSAFKVMLAIASRQFV